MRALAIRWRHSALALPLAISIVIAWPGRSDAFSAEQLFWVPGSCSPPCELFDVTGGGDFGTAAAFTTLDRSPGQIAWSSDLASAYVSHSSKNQVSEISAAGDLTVFATGIFRPTGLLRTADGRLLVASFAARAVFEITDGGDFLSAPRFAFGFSGPRNFVQLASGEILLADQTANRVYDITSGGDFSSETGFAFGFPGGPDTGPFDLVQDASGRIIASTFGGVFDITGGGDVSASPAYAWGREFMGLAVDGAGALLASVFETGEIYDITAGGDFSTASPFAWNLRGFSDTAFDTVPQAQAVLPTLAEHGSWLLASLLLLTGGVILSLNARPVRSRRFERRTRQPR